MEQNPEDPEGNGNDPEEYGKLDPEDNTEEHHEEHTYGWRKSRRERRRISSRKQR